MITLEVINNNPPIAFEITFGNSGGGVKQVLDIDSLPVVGNTAILYITTCDFKQYIWLNGKYICTIRTGENISTGDESISTGNESIII
jgi:hypothetical protein